MKMKTSKRQIESGIFETLERGDGTRKRVSLQPSYSALVTWEHWLEKIDLPESAISALEIREMNYKMDKLTDPWLLLDCSMFELRKEGGAKPQNSSDRYPAKPADKKGHCDLCRIDNYLHTDYFVAESVLPGWEGRAFDCHGLRYCHHFWGFLGSSCQIQLSLRSRSAFMTDYIPELSHHFTWSLDYTGDITLLC